MANAEQEAQEPIPGSNYHYWHDKVAKGEGAAPAPVPQPLAEAVAPTKSLTNIDKFSLLEEDDVRSRPTALDHSSGTCHAKSAQAAASGRR